MTLEEQQSIRKEIDVIARMIKFNLQKKSNTEENALVLILIRLEVLKARIA